MSGVRLLACAPTPALRAAVFGGDGEPDDAGLRAARSLSGRRGLNGDQPWVCGGSVAAAATARALGRSAVAVPALADPDFGHWTGSALEVVAARDPAAVQTWLTDPGAAPHGGESLAAVTARVGRWLDGQASQPVVAVAHPVVVRAAVASALELPPAALWRLDVAPLALLRLTCRAGRWHLHLPAT
ncbi:histidine phosphatase superfamily protein (branch 1) [Krasilnikovia cinnamomea]|uniref:Histidine phosphatase superfamily protein (Branch 1) n=1 Tax=Krasilnikovia cinnamomea TaxID=349313 RepID=A0A4Q7ZSY5_9ACTN|nr:histidine phosphatase family protein [Krasilnikovia cinnamomea]RZU54320.1 histidine phosphatase superfamily protein (branch 1) [Krasilnikovia cinnamomea]